MFETFIKLGLVLDLFSVIVKLGHLQPLYLSVGFLLPWYSVVCTVESLSSFYLLFIPWFVLTR